MVMEYHNIEYEAKVQSIIKAFQLCVDKQELAFRIVIILMQR